MASNATTNSSVNLHASTTWFTANAYLCKKTAKNRLNLTYERDEKRQTHTTPEQTTTTTIIPLHVALVYTSSVHRNTP